jgi:hypothetical protein
MDRARIAVALCLMASLAAAHDENYPKRDRITLSHSTVKLTLDFAVPAGDDARALRQIFDKDRSGKLSDEEAAKLTDYLVRQTVNFVVVTVDGKRVVPKFDKVTADPPGSGRERLGVRVEMSAPVKEPHHIKLEDRHKDRRLNIPVEVVLDGVELKSTLPPQSFVFAEHPLELDLK